MPEKCPTCGQTITYDDDTFAGRLGNAMNDAGLTRAKLAKKLGYKRTTQISRFLNGTASPSSIKDIEVVARAVDSTPAWLLYGVREPKLIEEEVE